jgi:hypothetical protein
MKFSFLLAFALLLCTAAAFADTVNDPGVIIRNKKGTCASCTKVGMKFSFTSTANNGGVFNLQNVSGSNWFNLKLTEKGVPASAIVCKTNIFATCHITTKNGVTTILVAGISGHLPGIQNMANFQIELHCPPGAENCKPWQSGMKFNGVANVPEPGTLAMVATGVGVLLNRRRKLFTA